MIEIVGVIGAGTMGNGIAQVCINGPAFDQVTTMSKFLCLGMPLSDVIAASTVNAAFALKRPELGSLKPGSVGDATILSVNEGRFDYVDVVGEHLAGDRKIASQGVVIAGRWWHPKNRACLKPLDEPACLSPPLPGMPLAPRGTAAARSAANLGSFWRKAEIQSLSSKLKAPPH